MGETPFASRVLACGAVLFALVTAACTPGPEMPAADPRATQQRVGDLPPPDVGEVRRVYGIAAPLPEGDWTDLAEVTGDGRAPYPEKATFWASTAGGVVDRLVVVSEQAGPSGYGAPFRPCGDDGHALSPGGPDGGLACWHVRAVSLGLAEDAPPQNHLVADFAEQNNLVVSPTMLSVRYLFSDGAVWRSVEYLFNPDLLAPAPGETLWRPSDWSRAEVMADPRRQAVVSALEDWGARWSTLVLPLAGT